MEDLQSIEGWVDLLNWFGYTPSFHDAEILSLHLERGGLSTLKVYTWNVTRDVDKKGYGIHDRHVVVTFTMEDILDLHLEGFSSQNVIGNLELRRLHLDAPTFGMQWLRPTQPPSKSAYELSIQPCFGLSGSIQARRVSISLAPGKLI
ncbi:Imm50 family immunity protein [Microvirga flavescens]|uniref:Imm50 family immunity protein n=1 Tax=Microvirga flavescens TaxID=2249811 RepID=UPI000DD7CFC5|nr:Imm50 family immunity protein [Microvirga flavescens]